MTVEPKLLPLRIRLPYATEEEFIEKYGANVARGGLFIATRSPKPEGTGLSFELVLVDGGRLLRGEGVVVKAQPEGPRAGMTVRFVRLDAFSKALIDRIVSRRSQLKEGTAEPGAAPTATTPGPEQTPAVRTEEATTGKRGRPVISAEALRKQAAMSASQPTAPVAPKPTTPAPPAQGVPVAREPAVPAAPPRAVAVPPAPNPATPAPVAPASPKQAAPVAPQQAATRAQQPAAKAPARPSAPPASKPAAAPPPAPAKPPATAEQQAPATPRPPLAAPPERTPVVPPVAQAVPTEPWQGAPSAPEPASPPAPTERPVTVAPERTTPEVPPRPTTQDLIANAVLEHLDPGAPESSPSDFGEPESLDLVVPESPEPLAPARTAPAPTEPPAPAPVEQPVTATLPPSAPVTTEPAPAPTAREAPSPIEPRERPSALPEVARDVPPIPEEPRRPSPELKGRRRAILDVPVTPPVTATPPEVVLGIDLGTSQARVAVHHQGTLRLVPLGEAQSLPSLVAVDETGQLLVGAAARAEAGRNPRHAALGLRRFLGLRARSPLVRAFGGPLPFPIAAGPHGDISIELRGGGILLPELAARLLSELKSASSTFLGHEATRAVLCVPAHFDDRQRAAMREAGALAGLNVLRLLSAPSAAALAFGHERGLARKRILVVEIGGGGLDVSVVQLTGDDLEVITTGGDPTVGGLDFDARVAEALASELQAQGVPRPEHPFDWAPLLAAAEAAKVALSEQEQVSIPLPGGLPALTLDRERLEALTADLVQRITLVVRQVLESSALTPQGLDEVLLLGGQGRSPLVRRRLEESLGVPVRADVESTHSAALGAALLGRGLLDAEAGKPGATVSEVLSVPIGVAERGGTLRRVFERNTRLPAEKTLVLPVTPGPLSLALFQGPSSVAAENEYLGTLAFSIERPGEAEVHFSLSQDGTLSLAATLPGVKRHPVTLAADMPEDAELEAVIARSPLEGEPETRPGGLLSGLRKLFGRR